MSWDEFNNDFSDRRVEILLMVSKKLNFHGPFSFCLYFGEIRSFIGKNKLTPYQIDRKNPFLFEKLETCFKWR